MEQQLSIWARIGEALAALLRGEGLSVVFDHLRGAPERSVAFTIAVIALGAKMAKADGQVTRNEVATFRRIFHIPVEEEAHAAMVFNLARTDVVGFDVYARKIASMFGPASPVLKDVLEGLFAIAVADGDYHDSEDAFLSEVARIFGIDSRCFAAMRAIFVPDAEPDPWTILQLPRDATVDDAHKKWRALVREAHPDRAIARGLPEEAIRFSQDRVATLNGAWEKIRESAAISVIR